MHTTSKITAASAVRSRRFKHVIAPALLAGLGLSISGLAGCHRAPAAQAAPSGPMPVSTLLVAPGAVELSQELPGRVSSFRVAEVRARVSGIVLKRFFTEGAEVKEGDLLYQIDPAPYEAALDNATGAQSRAKAAADNARIEEKRLRELLAAKAVSQQKYDAADATRKATEAELAATAAAVRTARINLGYTLVTAPIPGRIERSAVTEGAYVQLGAATLLTTIQQLDQMYVDLTQSSAALLRQRRARTSDAPVSAEVAAPAAANAPVPVEILLENGEVYSQRGLLQFSEVTVNPATGSFIQRVLVPNPDRVLLPGMFVRARVPEATLHSAITVPQDLVSRTPQGVGIVFVVGADNTAQPRPLHISRPVGNRWLVESGLAPGDRVITDRLQLLRPGMPVTPLGAATTAVN
jgi:membrane fusion protein (multidrug efflux system)